MLTITIVFPTSCNCLLFLYVKKIDGLVIFSLTIGIIVNACGSSCKQANIIRQKEYDSMIGSLKKLEISFCISLNQATGLCRSCDTRWEMNYTIICHLMNISVLVLNVLQAMFKYEEEKNRGLNHSLIDNMDRYDFFFIMLLMRKLLAEQILYQICFKKKDQNIKNAMHQIKLIMKENLQYF